MNKINLLLYIGGLGYGGAERVIATLCNHLDHSKFSITVCCRNWIGPIGEKLSSAGHDVVCLPQIEPISTPYLRFLTLKKLLNNKKIDIVHTHDTGCLADAAQCRIFGSRIRLVHTFHYGNYPKLPKSHLILETIFSRSAHQLVAVGYEQAKQIAKTLHVSPSRINVLYNGVEEPGNARKINMIEQYRNSRGNPVVIGSVSTLIEQKGITYLLDAAAILKDSDVNCIFVIAGDGHLRSELEKKRKQLNLTDYVNFIGWVDDASDNLIPDLDIFIQPSLWEANSIVLLEAMANGLPIVTTSVGESNHIIDDGINGRIFKPGDISAMAKILIELVSNPDLREELGQHAKDKFLNNFSLGKMIGAYEKIYCNEIEYLT